ncbi:MAG: RNA polymerase sigma factor [Planctomycetota bacterium]|nr:RNA polymerase sigma factor [Planctomycetota bacterium]
MPEEEVSLDEILQRGYRYALALTHDATRAEDLLHDALAAVMRRRPVQHVGYLLRAIRNRFIDLYRRERLIVLQPLDAVGEEALAALDAPHPAVAADEIEYALERLRPAEREALYLAAVEDYTAQEIADLTGRPRGTVLSLIHRARKKLRGFLAKGEAR